MSFADDSSIDAAHYAYYAALLSVWVIEIVLIEVYADHSNKDDSTSSATSVIQDLAVLANFYQPKRLICGSNHMGCG